MFTHHWGVCTLGFDLAGITRPTSDPKSYFLSALVWVATHSHLPFKKIQVSVNRP
jgi:hypothetical protein